MIEAQFGFPARSFVDLQTVARLRSHVIPVNQWLRYSQLSFACVSLCLTAGTQRMDGATMV